MRSTVVSVRVALLFILYSFPDLVNASWNDWWTYEGFSGPSFWGLVNADWKMCAKGQHQSPVNINPNMLLYDPLLRPLTVGKTRVRGTLINTGQFLLLEIDSSSKSDITISGGPFTTYRYRLSKVIIHFGLKDHLGSEHAIDGERFPGEIQLYGYNIDLYRNFSDALKMPNGIAAIATVVEIHSFTNPELKYFASMANEVLHKGKSVPFNSLSVYYLLPETAQYVTYEGSLTYPGCHETVTWVIMNKPVYINLKDLKLLRELKRSDENSPSSLLLGGGSRQLMALNRRTVRTNIVFKSKSSTCRSAQRTMHYKGVIYHEKDTYVPKVISFFNNMQRNSAQTELFKLVLHGVAVKETEAQDAWNLIRMACELLKKGVFTLISSGGDKWRSTLSALAKEMQVPLISWSPSSETTKNDFVINLLPSINRVIAEIICEKKWTHVTFLYQSAAGFEAAINELNLSCHHHIDNNVVLIHIDEMEWVGRALSAFRSSTSSIRRCNFVVATLGMTETTMETFKDGTLNITAIEQINTQKRIMTEYALEFADYMRIKPRGNLFTSEAAYMHDSIIVFRRGIEKLLRSNQSLFYGSFRRDQYWNSGYPGIYCVPAEAVEYPNRPFKPFDFGKQISKNLKNVIFDGLSGTVEFDLNGQRKATSFNVLEVKYSSRTLVTSFTKSMWKHGIGLVTDKSTVNFRRIQSKNTVALNNTVRIVSTHLNAPFVMYKADAENYKGNEKFEGYCVDLIKLLSEKIDNFPYEIQLTKDGRTGSMLPDGTWDGMIGTLLRGEADMAVSSLVINTARERVVDFSKPFMTTGISIMIKKPDDTQYQSSLFAFMQPLSIEVWMYILFAYIGISVVLYLVSRFTVSEWKVQRRDQSGHILSNDFSVSNCLWFTLASFMHQGIDILPRSLPGRIASSAWWFFILIIVSSYTANLAAFLTLEKMHAPIESAEDLAKQTKIKYGIQAGGSTAQFFKESTVQTYQRMWQFMTSQSPSAFVPSYDAGITRVRESKGRYAFLLEATTNDYTNNRKPCDTMKVGGHLNTVGYGVATPFGSELKSRINLAILELQEKGELKKLENKWWYEKSGGQCKTGTGGSSKASLTQSKVNGIFYVLIVGMFFSMLIAGVEFVHKSRLYARKQKITFWKSMQYLFTIAYHGKSPEGDIFEMQ